MGKRKDMKKGKTQIEHDVYTSLVGFFEGKIAGQLYMSETRPRDSKQEDAVIVAGAPSGEQLQKGRVRILIFVPDIDNGSGRPTPDLARLLELEPLGQQIIDTLHESLPDYSFEFLTTPYPGSNPGSTEHFVNINLQYLRKTF